MLLSFSVKNFRSFDDWQTLSMLPTLTKARSTETGVSSYPWATRIASIYGANGSGKSNLIKAVGLVHSLVASSATLASDDDLPYEPFLLKVGNRSSPCEFEVSFVEEGAVWDYSFSLLNGAVFSESLRSKRGSKGSRFKTLFSRDSESLEALNTSLAKYRVLLSEQTNANQLFLSKLDQSKDSVTKPAFHWIRNQLRILSSIDSVSKSISAKHCLSNDGEEVVTELLKSLDIRLSGIDVKEEEKEFPEEIFAILNSAGVEGPLDKTYTDHDVRFKLRDDLGNSLFLDLDEESLGTQNLFKLAGPLLQTLECGYTLFVDELNQSFHTNLLKRIIELFASKELNDSGAQLIFTSHDSAIMSDLERDEIWFMEKDRSASSELIALSEYRGENSVHARRRAAFSKRYLEGRFGSIPYPDTLKLAQLIISLRDKDANGIKNAEKEAS